MKENLRKKLIFCKISLNPSEKTEIFCTLEARKRELEKIIEYRTKGSILRATIVDVDGITRGKKIRSTS